MMNKNERRAVLLHLGELLRSNSDDYLAATIKRTALHNPWFSEKNQQQAIMAIANEMLAEDKLDAWLSDYDYAENANPHQVGLIMAGNLPLVGFHDVLCVFMSGHRARIKLSDKDPFLLPAVLRALKNIDERTEAYFSVVEKLDDFSAVIATGSNNSARYFEAYFGKYPHIIRRNRNAVAVLSGNESQEELIALGRDVFDYFGLGCRNVSKLYLPKPYNFEPLLEALHEYREIINTTKYKNNFDYNYAMYMMNRVEYQANGCVLLTENPSLQSPIATLHYEYYENLTSLNSVLKARAEEIQLIVSQLPLPGQKTFSFGSAQKPGLGDYADGVDTMDFLLKLG